MNEHEYGCYIKAGTIAAAVKREVRPLIVVGASLLSLAERTEQLIRDKGGEPAFPVNLSLNATAAHATPQKGETTMLTDKDILKIDLGVHVGGYVCDTAMTVAFNSDHADLVRASEEAVTAAVRLCVPGTQIKDISDVIEQTISGYGFKPISNLTGHGLEQYGLHTAPQIPNGANTITTELKEDQVLAIEPFATTGQGMVRDSGTAVIFSVLRRVPVRNADARTTLAFSETLHDLPFAERWLPFSSIKTRIALRELLERGAIHDYP